MNIFLPLADDLLLSINLRGKSVVNLIWFGVLLWLMS